MWSAHLNYMGWEWMRVGLQRKSGILLPEEGGISDWQIKTANASINLMCILLYWGDLCGTKDRCSKYSSNILGLHQPVVPTKVILTLMLFLSLFFRLLLKVAPQIFLKVKVPLGYGHMDSEISLGYCFSKTFQPVPCCSLLHSRTVRWKNCGSCSLSPQSRWEMRWTINITSWTFTRG